MPNTYTKLYIHCVFAVKYRAALLQPEWDERLRLYITGTIQNAKHKMLAINNMPDHLQVTGELPVDNAPYAWFDNTDPHHSLNLTIPWRE